MKYRLSRSFLWTHCEPPPSVNHCSGCSSLTTAVSPNILEQVTFGARRVINSITGMSYGPASPPHLWTFLWSHSCENTLQTLKWQLTYNDLYYVIANDLAFCLKSARHVYKLQNRGLIDPQLSHRLWVCDQILACGIYGELKKFCFTLEQSA